MNYQCFDGIKGERDCSERYEIIKSELPEKGVIIDIGSAQGYFPRRIADETENLTVSIEASPELCRFQRSWLNQKYYGKIALCNYLINVSMAKKLYNACEWFDCILMLSVLHWIPFHKEIVSYLSQITAKLIVEIPNTKDTVACGQKYIKEIGDHETYLKSITRREVRHLAKAKAHTSNDRDLWIVEGEVNRTPPSAYIDYPSAKRKSYQFYYLKDNLGNFCTLHFVINGSERLWIPGINVNTLAKLNCKFPSGDWWYYQAQAALLGEHKRPMRDCEIWNLLAIPNGVKWIDLFDTLPRRPETDCLLNIKDCFNE